MSEYLSDYHSLMWSEGEARIRKSASTSTAKSTVLRIEIEVFDAFRLGELLQDIQKAMRPPAAPPRPDAKPKARREP